MKAEELKQHAIDFVMWYDESEPDGRASEETEKYILKGLATL